MTGQGTRRLRPRAGVALVAALLAALVAALLAGAPVGAAAARAKNTQADAAVVTTESGPVRGMAGATVRSFLAIPYAAPPVGELRWRPPQPAARWRGLRDATKPAPYCPQPPTPYGRASTSEDCLYLNVLTPADANPADRYPVLFWIHGGALLVGGSAGYDPSRLVAKGVVVVTTNYRIGMLGFLAHPALSAESPEHASGNYGLMDQQAALAWVQRNVARFGGDPDNVTIFGESAGGLSVHSQLASPLAAGLFERAIVQSGAYSLTQPSLAAAEAAGQAFATRAGCADQSLGCLRDLPVSSLLAANTASTVVPDVDGHVLTQSVGAAFASGRFNRVSVIEGSNHDEWRLFVASSEAAAGTPLTADRYEAAIAATLGVSAATAHGLALIYPPGAYASPSVALGALGTDAIFACNARRALRSLVRYVPTYQYEFNDSTAPMRFFKGISFPTGAYHASEIQYLFDTPDAPVPATLNAEQSALADAIVTYWTDFAKTGDPNADSVPTWPTYDAAAEQLQSLELPAPVTTTGFALDHRCAVWGG
ncbi:MAG TPA: carboxylesterase family protein [Actinomycetes bacterium]|nr:carboxylesterase family protein [Actinomycetes bacterium]